MSLIKVLPENLVNQIAAGEVVERPASVVKELMENSLDAGAERIVVEVKDGGKSFIKVSDNGGGMSREDCELALKRHATSKISEEADLWKIKTMGFRGEALASIASVAKMTLKSKRAEDQAGVQIDADGGEILSIKDVGMSDGTRIEVYDLFFNTPARQKYLSKDSTELSHITALFNKMALANPGVALKLIHNEKSVMDLPKVTDLGARISDVFGKATFEAMIPVFYGGSDFKVEGFVGKPLLSRSSSKHQYFFVNGRPIQHFILANTIKQAFHSMLMENKKPVFVVNISIDPGLIDVNVHPRKVEIRFEDQQTVIKRMYNCVKAALEKHNLIPKGYSESRRYMSEGLSGGGDSGGDRVNYGGSDWGSGGEKVRISSKVSPVKLFGGGKSGGNVQDALDFSKEMFEKRNFQGLEDNEQLSCFPVAQVADSYIVAQNEEGLVLIDQHAAHERVRYEQLMDQFENQKKSSQNLLTPLEIEFSADEVTLMKENEKIFEDLGFEISEFGGKSYVVQSVPVFFVKEDIDQVIKGVLDDIINQKSPSKFQGRSEEIITYMACRSAIKFGKKLGHDEMRELIKQMDNLKRPYTCPHGRPTMVSLTLDEMARMFGRK